MRAPNGWEEWRKLLAEDVKSGKLHRVMPYCLVVSLAIGGLSGYLAPSALWADGAKSAMAAYSVAVTLSGIVLALTWSAFARITECASAQGFSTYLRDRGMLGVYFGFITFIQSLQVLALALSSVGLITSLIGLSAILGFEEHATVLDRALLALVIASHIWAFRWAIGAVKLMTDLVWYRSEFEANTKTAPAK